ncbi:MAG TPA: ribonuclease III [Polyangiaceae bacterium]|jgi:ribonuclease-3|nr:ribonuclease III [Polyangiaceae bacterium]
MSRSDVAERFGLSPDSRRLEEALTHPSFANERRDGQHYQRLEFLGDAVLQLCASEALWRAFPDAAEGELTRRRAQLVNGEALAKFARENGIPAELLVGKGAESSGVRSGTNVLADVVEALIAATYLDNGYQAARSVCDRIVGAGLDEQRTFRELDPKTLLQERAQGLGLATPEYAVTDLWGPAHERMFKVEVKTGAEVLAQGVGRSKRAAERDAAEKAIAHALLQGGVAHAEPEVASSEPISEQDQSASNRSAG